MMNNMMNNMNQIGINNIWNESNRNELYWIQ